MARFLLGCLTVLLLGCAAEAPDAEPTPTREVDPACAELCKLEGRCTLTGGEDPWCIVADDIDCQMSDPCKTDGKCYRSPWASWPGGCMAKQS